MKEIERSVEKQKDIYNCFIDYSKAFDTVKHDSLVELLQSLDVDDADTRLLTNLYWTQTAAVRCDKDLSEWMSIKQGVRQGSPSKQFGNVILPKRYDNP